MMTKESLALLLNKRQYRNEITKEEEKIAKESGLIVIFGYSDDNIEFRGVIHDEVGCYGIHRKIYFNQKEIVGYHDEECECKYCGFEEAVKKSECVDAIWDKDGYSWQYNTDLPHSTFEILEDDEAYCKGIVIDVRDFNGNISPKQIERNYLI